MGFVDNISMEGLSFVAGQWGLTEFLNNATVTLETWIGYIFVLMGVVAMGWAMWQIVSGMISHGKKPTNWGMSLLLLIVGGMMFGAGANSSGGFTVIQGIAEQGSKTITDLGSGQGPIN